MVFQTWNFMKLFLINVLSLATSWNSMTLKSWILVHCYHDQKVMQTSCWFRSELPLITENYSKWHTLHWIVNAYSINGKVLCSDERDLTNSVQNFNHNLSRNFFIWVILYEKSARIYPKALLDVALVQMDSLHTRWEIISLKSMILGLMSFIWLYHAEL